MGRTKTTPVKYTDLDRRYEDTESFSTKDPLLTMGLKVDTRNHIIKRLVPNDEFEQEIEGILKTFSDPPLSVPSFTLMTLRNAAETFVEPKIEIVFTL